MGLLKEDISRIKEIMGIDEEPNDIDAVEGEIEEQEDGGGESAPSSPSMDKWETGVNRGKANPIDQNSKWETGIQRGKGNPVW
jgi:hypothetical protein